MNAIILAAGMGTRLRPLTDTVPKALVPVTHESFFSRQVRLVRSAGIRDITVVTGYRHEAFEPWRADSGICFVHNEHYNDWNNLYTMYLVRDSLGDTLVLDGDVWIAERVLPESPPETSRWYVGYRGNAVNEWSVHCDASGRVIDISTSDSEGYILSGISYWSKADGAVLAARLSDCMSRPDAASLYWDDVPRSLLASIVIHAEHIGKDDWAEVDTVEELEALRERCFAR